MLPPEALAVGTVTHRRRGPRPHRFRYRHWMTLVDVDALPALAARCGLWSVERRAPVAFWRADGLQRPESSLGEAVRALVTEHTGTRLAGRLLMLAQPRVWGACFNPVHFYFCHDSGGALAAIVAEITNTPWGERHAYVLPVETGADRGQTRSFGFDKAFHVSPFMPMNLRYDWRFRLEQGRIAAHMRLYRDGAELFDATMTLALTPLSAGAMWRLPFAAPAPAALVTARIYWQALRLWLKRTPFHPHPATLAREQTHVRG